MTMKLIKILHQIDEGRKIIDAEYGFKKLTIAENPEAKSVVNELDKNDNILGGWISKYGSWVWQRDDASHDHIAKQIGIDPKEAIAFYIIPEKYDEGKVIDVLFEVSEFSGSKSFTSLMDTTLVNNIMNLLAKRKESKAEADDFNVDDLVASLGGSDY